MTNSGLASKLHMRSSSKNILSIVEFIYDLMKYFSFGLVKCYQPSVDSGI